MGGWADNRLVIVIDVVVEKPEHGDMHALLRLFLLLWQPGKSYLRPGAITCNCGVSVQAMMIDTAWLRHAGTQPVSIQHNMIANACCINVPLVTNLTCSTIHKQRTLLQHQHPHLCRGTACIKSHLCKIRIEAVLRPTHVSQFRFNLPNVSSHRTIQHK